MKRIVYIFILALCCMSCDDILDLKPLNAVSESDVWTDPALVKLYVNGRYNELPHGFQMYSGGLRMTGITDESYHMHETRCDNYTNGSITADNMYFFGGFWNEAYNAIRNNNIFLENIDTSIGDATTIGQYTAEIRWLRAFFYVELFSRYGAVPLLENTFSLDDDFNVPRTSVNEIVDFVVKELDLAIPYLLDKDKAVGENFGRITKGAAIGLKIRALLYAASPLYNTNNDQSKWQLVADACEELFGLGQYSLSDSYKDLFLNAAASEVIFFKQFIDEYGPESYGLSDSYFHCRGGQRVDEWRFPSGSGGWVSENPLQGFVDQYETLSGEIPVLGYTGNDDNLQPILNPKATDYDPDHPYKNRDPRLSYSVYYDGLTFQGREVEMWDGGKDSRNINVDWWWNASKLGYGVLKSLDESWTYTSTVGSDQPWIYMRLAEFYLTYAEANYHLGKESVAIEYVNKVRSRAGVNMPAVTASGTGLLEKIKHERKIELAFEGNRWYDARRWKDAVTDFSKNAIGVEVLKDSDTGDKSYRYYVFNYRNFPEHNYLWPIPSLEIKKSNLEQNPGY